MMKKNKFEEKIYKKWSLYIELNEKTNKYQIRNDEDGYLYPQNFKKKQQALNYLDKIIKNINRVVDKKIS